MIGIVFATDEAAALKAALEEFGIKSPHQQKKLMIRRQG
jgi:hypothetical protein